MQGECNVPSLRFNRCDCPLSCRLGIEHSSAPKAHGILRAGGGGGYDDGRMQGAAPVRTFKRL